MAWDDNPKCEHVVKGELEVIVTNQPGAYDKTRSHRSCWVCARPECVWDAAGWVMSGTGEKPWWRVGTEGEWSDQKYPGAVA